MLLVHQKTCEIAGAKYMHETNLDGKTDISFDHQIINWRQDNETENIDIFYR